MRFYRKNKCLAAGTALAFFAVSNLAAQKISDAAMDSLRREYIRHYKDIAMDEMERSGIPASIKLAQGILETRAGTSDLARQANNHFGIKCGKNWTGAVQHKKDDDRDRKGQPIESCFRKYASVVDGYADHSAFILNPEKQYRYGFLFDLDPRDYRAWALGLQSAGYSSAEHYAEKLIHYIELHALYVYDQHVFAGRIAPKRLAEVHGVKMVQARAGETLRSIAQLYNLAVEKLVEYNDLVYTPEQPLGLGDRVFVQEKHETWPATPLFHPVDSEQTLFDIAQRYALRLDALRRRNGLQPGQEPAAQTQIRLRGNGVGQKKIAVRSAGSVTKGSPDAPAAEARRGGLIIEMLPEEPLESPVPMFAPDQSVAAPGREPEPEIFVDMKTGTVEWYHTVAKGETLVDIARRYAVSTEQIKQLNKLKGNVIRPGQTLRVN